MTNPTWVADLFAAIDRRDADGFADLLTEDVVFTFGNAEPVHGRDAARAAVAGFFGAVAGLRHELQDTWTCGEAVVTRGLVTYTRHDDSTLTVPFADVFLTADGRIASYQIYIDTSQLFA